VTPGQLLLVAAGCLAAGIVLGAWWPKIWLGLTLAGTAAALGAAVLVLSGTPQWELTDGWPVGGEPLHLRLDALSALFLALMSVVGAAGAVYSREYWSDHHYPESAPRGRMWWSALLLSMVVVLVSSNGLHFLMGWELFTVSAFFLVTLDGQRREVRAAGWLYLVASHAGTVCLFAFFATLAARAGGSWNLGPVRDQVALAPLFWLAIAGFSVKAGVFPMHVWLPSAHANAPSHVSAIMSGVAIKMGVYGIMRFSGWMPVPPAAGWVVIAFGATSALLGIAFAFAQNDFKRLLAYCSVENVGIIMIGLGAALLAVTHGDAPWGRLALAGALLHVWNHGAFKSLLFFGAGSVLHATGTREMSRLGGLWRLMPWTAGLFALGAMAVSGLPPLNGFVSEWLVYLGLFDAVTGRGPPAGAAMLAVLMLGMAGALALASFVKAGAMIFLGAPRTQTALKAHESGWGMRGPMLVQAGVCVTIGLAPMVFWPAIARAAGVWHPAWALAATPAPLWTLSWVHVALAGVAVAAAVAVWQRARQNGLKRALTWDCAYVAPTARMQYTGGSFAGIAAGWFGWMLQPVRRLQRPRGAMPGRSIRQERTPETVLERVIAPVAELIMQVSTAVRRLQRGHLQTYILYLVAGLTALSGIVFLGGRP
jgi:hydrogenase-4 component B